MAWTAANTATAEMIRLFLRTNHLQVVSNPLSGRPLFTGYLKGAVTCTTPTGCPIPTLSIDLNFAQPSGEGIIASSFLIRCRLLEGLKVDGDGAGGGSSEGLPEGIGIGGIGNGPTGICVVRREVYSP